MQFTLHATRRTPHGASHLVQAMSAWLGKTRRAPSRHIRDARVYFDKTMVMHKLSTPPPPPTPPASTHVTAWQSVADSRGCPFHVFRDDGPGGAPSEDFDEENSRLAETALKLLGRTNPALAVDEVSGHADTEGLANNIHVPFSPRKSFSRRRPKYVVGTISISPVFHCKSLPTFHLGRRGVQKRGNYGASRRISRALFCPSSRDRHCFHGPNYPYFWDDCNKNGASLPQKDAYFGRFDPSSPPPHLPCATGAAATAWTAQRLLGRGGERAVSVLLASACVGHRLLKKHTRIGCTAKLNLLLSQLQQSRCTFLRVVTCLG